MSADPLRSGPQLRLWRTGRWLTIKDVQGPLVVLVHGLASSSSSVSELAEHIDRSYRVAVFDYVSHDGIEGGANDLAHRLARLTPLLNKRGLVVVGHSMGGLVAKHLARHADRSLNQVLRGLVMLGTPHAGVSGTMSATAKRLWLGLMLDLAERFERPDPFARSLMCPAARQLIGNDAQAIVNQLLEADREDPLRIPVLTFSGGRNYIELFEPGTRWNGIANRWLQSMMTSPNDGLVEEASSDITRFLAVPLPTTRHCNDYRAWSLVNHTHLLRNQDIGDVLVEWLGSVAFGRSSTLN